MPVTALKNTIKTSANLPILPLHRQLKVLQRLLGTVLVPSGCDMTATNKLLLPKWIDLGGYESAVRLAVDWLEQEWGGQFTDIFDFAGMSTVGSTEGLYTQKLLHPSSVGCCHVIEVSFMETSSNTHHLRQSKSMADAEQMADFYMVAVYLATHAELLLEAVDRGELDSLVISVMGSIGGPNALTGNYPHPCLPAFYLHGDCMLELKAISVHAELYSQRVMFFT